MLNRVVRVGAAIAAGVLSVPAVSADATATDAIVLYSAGIDGILDDPKDANLHAALVMMEQNGLSLPPDAGERGAAIANLLASVAMSELDMRMTMASGPVDPQMPFGLSVSSRGNAGVSAEELINRLRHVMSLTGAPPVGPSEAHPGLMTTLVAPNQGPPVVFGSEDGQAVFVVNADPQFGAIDWSGCGLPAGVDPLMGAIVDFSAMQPILGVAAMFEPQAAAFMSSFGIMGPDAMRIEFAMGRGDNLMHIGGRIANYGKHFGSDLVAEGIQRANLQVIPADAVDVQVSRFNLKTFLGGLLAMADSFAPPMGEGPGGEPIKASDMARQQAKMMLGVDPKTELIDYLGDSFAMYRSVSTGGGGLMSGVMAIGLSNADGMATTLGTLSARVNAMAAPMTQGYVQLSSWSHPDCGEVISLTFPGVPVPFELSLVVRGDWLLATLTPQAMVAACRQLGSKTSIMDNPRFASAVGRDAIGAVQVHFTDIPSQLADGYGIATGIMNAISNYTRPRTDASTGIPLVMPPYAELIEGASPCVLTVRTQGDDLVYAGTCDSSVNVLVTGLAANIASMLPLVAPMALGVVLPAIESARDAARNTEAKVHARVLAMACIAYQADTGDWPESLDVLVDEHYLDQPTLENPLHPGMGWEYHRPDPDHKPSDVLIHGGVGPWSSDDVPAALVDGSVIMMSPYLLESDQ